MNYSDIPLSIMFLTIGSIIMFIDWRYFLESIDKIIFSSNSDCTDVYFKIEVKIYYFLSYSGFLILSKDSIMVV